MTYMLLHCLLQHVHGFSAVSLYRGAPRGLPCLPRSHHLSVPARHKPGAPHPDTHPLLCCKEECFSRPCKADSHPTTLLPRPFAGFSTFCSPFSGQKGSPRPQRLFNPRDPSTLPVPQVFIVYSMPSFALESTTLRPTVCREEEGCCELNVSPHTHNNSYVEALTRM